VNDEHTKPVESRTEEQLLGSETAWPLPAGHTHVRRWQAGYGEYRAIEATASGGLTKRELFAAMALQAVITNDHQNIGYETGAGHAVKYADALLKELAK